MTDRRLLTQPAPDDQGWPDTDEWKRFALAIDRGMSWAIANGEMVLPYDAGGSRCLCPEGAAGRALSRSYTGHPNELLAAHALGVPRHIAYAFARGFDGKRRRAAGDSPAYRLGKLYRERCLAAGRAG